VTPQEVANEIKHNINPRNAPVFHLITGGFLKQLLRKGVVKFINLINVSFRLYMPQVWKIAKVNMIPKLGKPLNEVTSHRLISLQPVVSELSEKLLLKRLIIIIERKPMHQFGLTEKHSTIEQVHRLIGVIVNTLEERNACATISLDVKQPSDKVWHKGLMT
jgi:hypothetical protein